MKNFSEFFEFLSHCSHIYCEAKMAVVNLESILFDFHNVTGSSCMDCTSLFSSSSLIRG